MDSQVLIKYFWIVLAIAVLVIFYFKIDSFKAEDKQVYVDFKSDFYAKEVALLVNRMVFSEANEISVEYKLDKDYNIELNKKEVIVRYKTIEQKKNAVAGDVSRISFEKTREGVLIKKNE